MKMLKSKKGNEIKVYSRRFIIDVCEDNLHLNQLIYWDKPVKEFLNSYDVEIRELDEDEIVTTMWGGLGGRKKERYDSIDRKTP
mgnify:CR=1 FL=1